MSSHGIGVFDTPDGIELWHYPRTSHQTRDPVTGELSLEDADPKTRIEGNLDRAVSATTFGKGLFTDIHKDSGIDASGGMRLFTAAPLRVNDRIEVRLTASHPNDAIRTFRVAALVHDYAWFEQFAGPSQRREWHLILEDPAERAV